MLKVCLSFLGRSNNPSNTEISSGLNPRIAPSLVFEGHVISEKGENMKEKIGEYIVKQAGAMAVEWVFLTGALVLLVGAAYPKLHEAALSGAGEINARMEMAGQ